MRSTPKIRTWFLQIVALWSFAVAAPLYGIISGNAEFLVAHRLGPIELLGIVFVLSGILPALLFVPTLALARSQPAWAWRLHRVWICALLVVTFAPLAREVLPVQALGGLAVAGGAALLSIWAYHRFARVRTYVAVLSIAAVVFPVHFLFYSPVAKLLARASRAVHAGAIQDPPPVVLIVFDEINTQSLMDADRRIDSVRFPTFARLAEEADWYRNATAVDGSTTYAVPAILTGRYPPGESRLPVQADYPQNLLSLLGESHQLNVSECVTTLAPDSLADLPIDPGRRLASLGRDMAVIFLHSLLPENARGALPSLLHGWKGFEKPNPEQKPKRGVHWRLEQVEEFVGGIRSAGPRSLHFLHVLLPHHHYNSSSTGNLYAPVGVLDGLVENNGHRNLWVDEQALVDVAQQRYLLQVGFTDTLLGRILDALREKGIYEEALLIVTADHGVSFRAGLSNRALSAANASDILPVPLFVKLPGQREGRMRDEYVESVDIFPTILEVLGVEAPPDLDGRSLVSASFRDRTYKRAWAHGEPVAGVGAYSEATAFLDLDAQLALFGSRSSLSELVAFPDTHRWLLGRATRELPVESSGRIEVELDQVEELSRVDPESGFVPLYLSGRVLERDGLEGPLELAIAVNGSIRAMARTVDVLGAAAEFRVVLPEAAIRAGSNRVDVLLLTNADGTLKLTLGRVSPGALDRPTLAQLQRP